MSALSGAAIAQRDVYLPVAQNGTRSPAGYGMSLRNGAQVSDFPNFGAGWYYAWYVVENPPRPHNMDFVQCVNVTPHGPAQGWDVVVRTARANPGSTWLLGNEIDVPDQNGMTPEQYAPVYYQLYQVIKLSDPTAIVATGSLAQWTPSRQVYMERVLAEYRRLYGVPMPVDVWNVHGYVQPEDVIGLPVGVQAQPAYVGEGWRHRDAGTFAQQLLALRRWLDRTGYAGVPIIVSEYGVLWPASDAEVAQYMRDTWAWLASSGVVQRWAWFSLNDDARPGVLVDESGVTIVGRTFAALAGGER